jgi:hypothetical protein
VARIGKRAIVPRVLDVVHDEIVVASHEYSAIGLEQDDIRNSAA